MRTQGASRRGRCLGAAAVELGLLLVPLTTLVFGVTEYGRAIYTYNALAKSVRDAARHMTTYEPTNPNPEADARNLAVYGNTAGTGAPLAPDLTTAMVQICDAASCPATHSAVATGSGAINLVTVRISGYQYNSIVTYVAPAVLNFSNIAATMRSHL